MIKTIKYIFYYNVVLFCYNNMVDSGIINNEVNDIIIPVDEIALNTEKKKTNEVTTLKQGKDLQSEEEEKHSKVMQNNLINVPQLTEDEQTLTDQAINFIASLQKESLKNKTKIKKNGIFTLYQNMKKVNLKEKKRRTHIILFIMKRLLKVINFLTVIIMIKNGYLVNIIIP
jgi:hypothetical protein